MFGIPFIEWVGYAASIMIAISLIMTDMVKLRIINSIYGFVVKAYPVGIINTFIFIVNMYYLYKAYNNK